MFVLLSKIPKQLGIVYWSAWFPHGASSNTLRTNETNERIADKTNDLNYKMWQEQKEYDYQMWQENNEYNTPANQRALAEAAGINPNIIASSIAGSGTSTSAATSGNRPDAVSWTAENPASEQSAYVSNMNDIAANFQNSASQIAQTQYTNAMAEQVQIDNQSRLIQNLTNIDEARARTHFTRSNTALNQIEELLQNKIFNSRVRSAQLDNELKDSQITKTDLESTSLQIQNDIASENLAWLPKEKVAGLSYTLAQTALVLEQKGVAQETKKQIIANTALTWASENGIKIDNRIKEACEDLSIGISEANYLKSYYDAIQYSRGDNLGGHIMQDINNFTYHTDSYVEPNPPTRKARKVKR